MQEHFKTPLNVVNVEEIQETEEVVEDDDFTTHTLDRLSSAATCLVAGVEYTHGQQEKSNGPVDACMLDWQLARFGHPCLDVAFFVWTSIDRKLRHRHYNDLIELYHNSFSSFLRELGGDPDVCFPMSTFKEHLKKFSVFGIFASIWVVLTNLSEDVPNVHAADTADKIVAMLSTVTCEGYFVRMKEVLEDFLEYGYDMIDC